MSTDQFDPVQVVRIRMKCIVACPHVPLHRIAERLIVHVPPLSCEMPSIVWSDRMSRRIAEADVAGGPYHLSLEHAGGLVVLSAAIVPWRFN